MYPLFQEIAFQPPLKLFEKFAHHTGAVFFDSADLNTPCARFSYIAIQPVNILISKNGKIQFKGKTFVGNPFDILQQELKQNPLKIIPELPSFQGGAAGFFSYELYQHLESIPFAEKDDMDFPDMTIGFYDLVIAFDHKKEQAWVFSTGYPELKDSDRLIRAKARLENLLSQINDFISENPQPLPATNCPEIVSNFIKEHYQQTVQKVVNYILSGDIFEANLSQRFYTILPYEMRGFDLYKKLRQINPAPFAAFLNWGDIIIASASPERFLKLSDGCVESRPIKGTRRRGKNDTEDKSLAADLLASEKDHSENIMIVDLLRNDLSRVCEDASVLVTQLCGLESYTNVHHLVSVIIGKLQTGLDAIDLMKVCFPGGSITGAPKIRAMEIIAELEPNRRGPYCGSLGYIGFNGEMDTSITIRTFCIKDDVVTFQAGGAVVLDSDPILEYEETLTKVATLKKAITKA